MSVENLADIFSILFYMVLTVYVVFGLYTLYLNPKSRMNHVFFAVCLALSVWAFAFSMGNVAQDYEKALFWRRIGSLGWGTMYSLLLHFSLILTERKKLLKNKSTYVFLYLPAILNIVIFGLYGPIAKTQYNLEQIEAGWINISLGGIGDLYFNSYYLLFSLLSLFVVWSKKGVEKDTKKKMSSLIITVTLIFGIVAGTLTDIITNAYFSFRTPQLGVIFAVIPILGFFYSIKKNGLMTDKVEMTKQEGEVLGQERRMQFYRYISLIFIVGSILNIAHYFNFKIEIENVILFSSILLTMGLIFWIIPLTKVETFKQDLILFVLLSVSVVLILTRFMGEYGSNIVWPIPLIFMLLSAVFRQKIFLLTIVLTTILAQYWAWLRVPEITIRVTQFDYLSRIILYILFGLLAFYINRVYQQRIQENDEQTKIQRLMSQISAALVSVNMENLDEKINWILQRNGEFFGVDRTYLFQSSMDLSTATYTHEWCAPDIAPAIERIGTLQAEEFPWWMERMNAQQPFYIPDVACIPKEGQAERGLLEVQQVKSLIFVPVISKGKPLGFLGFNSIKRKKVWRESDHEVLQIMSNVVSDALVKVKAEKEINYMAYYDALTGLANRTLFQQQLEKEIALASRSEKFIGILFLDLDSFKEVNDMMGHEAGDMLLKEIAQRFSQCVRKYDTVGRFGGDEFLIMFPQMDTQEQIKQAGDKLMSIFKDPVILDGQEFHITASAGVAVYPVDGEDVETLIRCGDLAMYASKDNGKNQVTFCSHIMKEEIKEKLQLTNDLYHALEREELLLYYQPQVEIDTGKIVGLEALIRWQHPERGMVSPANFIPLAEQTGLIHPIGEWVLKTACRQNKEWQDKGFSPIVMAVNLSVEQFRRPHLTQVVANALEESGLSPAYLELEITESIAIKESDYIIPILNNLKEQGVAISIDDFGTAYSSLSRLKELPIDRIKMAMEFVQGIDKGTKDEAIVMVIINLAKSLGLRVIAEGVETKGQLAFLTKGVCHEVQGYYFYRPMPAAEVEKII